MIQLAPRTDNHRWQASTTVKLPCAPLTAVFTHDKELLITCDTALLVVGNDNFFSTRLKPFLEDGLWPTSSALSGDEQKLYIGARQYVIEVDLHTWRLRYLVPDESFLNKLPVKEQEQIRQQFGG